MLALSAENPEGIPISSTAIPLVPFFNHLQQDAIMYYTTNMYGG